MLFNSSEFIFLFLPACLLATFLSARYGSKRIAAFVMLCASFMFYAYFSVKLILLLVVSILFNFHLGRAILQRPRHGKSRLFAMVFGVVVNICVLAYFKYTNFFLGNANSLLGTSFVLQNIVLPIGISFFTFQKIGYLVDAYRGDAEQYDFLGFCLFVMYFPQLIAGPIVHHKDIIPQFREKDAFRYNPANFSAGVALFVCGLFKKVVIADGLAAWVGPVFDVAKSGAHVASVDAWMGALSFTFQIYFDFSGYTDMALGLALMSGIRLPLNFNSPYKATSIADFWRRWHMTLSTFMRDYIYIPLGGNRYGRSRQSAALLVTMLIGGLWHGAAWTFVAWGGIHGLYLTVNHGWRGLSAAFGIGPMPAWLSRAMTFLAVVLAWVFFRSEGFKPAWLMLESMAGLSSVAASQMSWSTVWVKSCLLLVLLAWVWLLPNSQSLVGYVRAGNSHVDRQGASANPMAAWWGRIFKDGHMIYGTTGGAITALFLLAVIIYQSVRNDELHKFIYFQF